MIGIDCLAETRPPLGSWLKHLDGLIEAPLTAR
jgi:hypothetical protein